MIKLLEVKLATILVCLVALDAVTTGVFCGWLGWFTEANPFGFNILTIVPTIFGCTGLLWACWRIDEADTSTRLFVLTLLSIMLVHRLFILSNNLSLLLNYL